MDYETIENIKKKQGSPLIGIIGSTRPTEIYNMQMGIQVGYEIRKFLDNSKGKIFTGGVNGVGVDSYVGVLKFCIENIQKKGYLDESKFFVAIPKFDAETRFEDFFPREINIPYSPSSAYFNLANLSKENKLEIEVIGENMEERREKLAKLTDLVVVVNGGAGTFEEAIMTLNASKPVISLNGSGGAAQILNFLKNDIDISLFIKKYHNAERIQSLDKSNLYNINDPAELKNLLKKLGY